MQRNEAGLAIIHDYPFENLLPKSHIHPKFAILQDMDKVARLYMAWTRKRPARAMEDPTYNKPEPDAEDDEMDDSNDEDDKTSFGLASRK